MTEPGRRSGFAGVTKFEASFCAPYAVNIRCQVVSHVDLDISGGSFFVPRDRNDTCHYSFEGLLDRHRMLRVNWTVSGLECEFLLHADCWTVIERIIGHQAEDRLDLLIQAMKDGWDKNSYDVSELISPPGSDKISSDLTGIILPSDRRMGSRVLPTTHQYRLFPVTDPIDIPALRILIAKSKKSLTSTDRVEEASEEDTELPAPLTRMYSGPGPGTMPVEISALILRQLPEWLDVKNTLNAFPWKMSDFLWRDLIPYDLIFGELDGIPVSGVGWKVLHAGIVRLLDISLAMKNQQRIVRVVKETHEDFLELLKHC